MDREGTRDWSTNATGAGSSPSTEGIRDWTTNATGTTSSSPSTRSQSKNKVPRLYHHKSRTGCQRCRARRVKCCETYPVCIKCSRHGVDCVYDRGVGPAKSPVNPPARNAGRKTNSTRPTVIQEQARETEHSSIIASESRSRRLLELRLLHNYIENVCHSLVACNYLVVDRTWQFEVPRMALEQDGLLHEIFSMSSLQLLISAPEDFDLRAAHRVYHSTARAAINIELGHITRNNADAMWFASLLLQIDLFASLQGRTLEPYAPPLKWLELSRDRGYMLVHPPPIMSGYLNANVIAIMQSNPNLTDQEQLFSAANRESLIGLLTLDRHEEMWDAETQQAYERTLSYIGSIKMASMKGEHNLVLAHRIIAFPLIVPLKFIKFVEKQHPRALAVLASFFYIASKHSTVWWMGTTPLREFQAIKGMLPPQWQPIIAL